MRGHIELFGMLLYVYSEGVETIKRSVSYVNFRAPRDPALPYRSTNPESCSQSEPEVHATLPVTEGGSRAQVKFMPRFFGPRGKGLQCDPTDLAFEVRGGEISRMHASSLSTGRDR